MPPEFTTPEFIRLLFDVSLIDTAFLSGVLHMFLGQGDLKCVRFSKKTIDIVPTHVLPRHRGDRHVKCNFYVEKQPPRIQRLGKFCNCANRVSALGHCIPNRSYRASRRSLSRASRGMPFSRGLVPVLLLASARALVVIEHSRHVMHAAPPGNAHPETPNRIHAAKNALLHANLNIHWENTTSLKDTHSAIRALQRVHSTEHLDAVQSTSRRGGGGFDADTYCAPGSWDAVLDGTNAWLEAVAIAERAAGPALALARPPGHHATRDLAMGFCLVNYAAAATADYLERNPEGQVAVLDWDVHHGNGVAAILADEPRARYCSTHEEGGFPRSGLDELDRGPQSNLLHLPLPPGCDGVEYLRRLKEDALPFLLGRDINWQPDILLICAGYDALEADSLAGMRLEPDDFAQSIRFIVEEFGFPQERIALGLEGGYSLDLENGLPAGIVKTCEAFVSASS